MDVLGFFYVLFLSISLLHLRSVKYINDFEAYFRYLCEQHPLLLHSETSGQQVFEVRPVEEAFAAFRTGAKEKDYFVRMILPTIGLSNGGTTVRKEYQFGLMVGKYYSRREDSKLSGITALGAAEKVADQIISRMVMDSQNDHPLLQNCCDRVDALNLTGDVFMFEGDGSYAAVLYMFDLSTPRMLDTACQTITWADGGLTAY